jgi:predicted alpha/beta-hydrolase family hydrolase
MSDPSSIVPFAAGSVRGFLHRPGDSNGPGLILTHGAGANCEAPLLVSVANAFSANGFHVLRIDLPFRQKRRFGPPFPAAAAEDRAGLREAMRAMRALTPGPLFLGGHSYGGRQASILASEDRSVATALLLLSYPLHPPAKPQQLRTAHFPSLRTPALFVHGTKDPFGSDDEMRTALALIPARTELALIEGAGHDLARGKIDIAARVVQKFEEFRTAAS